MGCFFVSARGGTKGATYTLFFWLIFRELAKTTPGGMKFVSG